MNKDLVDEVSQAISSSTHLNHEDVGWMTIDVMRAFAGFLKSRRYYSVDEMLSEIRSMMLLPTGDFREEFDEFFVHG